MYPVASCNDKDFQNLMDVYMDAVLNPNIYKRGSKICGTPVSSGAGVRKQMLNTLFSS